METPTHIIKRYCVTYVGGITQTKTLISNEAYQEELRPRLKEIWEIEDRNKGKENSKSRSLKYELRQMFGDYSCCVSEGSPLGESIESGLLMLLPQQGNHVVTWQEI